jgi:hypothetical protein
MINEMETNELKESEILIAEGNSEMGLAPAKKAAEQRAAVPFAGTTAAKGAPAKRIGPPDDLANARPGKNWPWF